MERSGTGPAPDAIRPLTRWVALGIIPFLAAAFVVLYGVPDRTTEFFAWTIRPEMTPIIMGAGYGAGVYFFARVATGHRWHTVAPVFLGITAFTWFMAVATVLHWANFNHGHHTFYLWVILYAVTPILVPALWVLNSREGPPGHRDAGILLPRTVRLVGGGLGIVIVFGAVAIFLVPDFMIASWPWTVSPFTARILAGWFGLLGVVNVAVASDRRWSAARILVQSQIIGFGLVVLGAIRVWDNFDRANPLTWVVVGGMLAYLIAITIVYYTMESRTPRSAGSS